MIDKQNIDNITVLIVGDVMLDEYVKGTVNRVSPEAPVPVLDVFSTSSFLGGAANVALNIATLGAKPLLVSVVGDDAKADTLFSLLQSQNISTSEILRSKNRITTVKQRFTAGNKQLIRADYEDVSPISFENEIHLLNKVNAIISTAKPNIIVLQDYNKGIFTENVISGILKMAQEANVKVAVDPKKVNFDKYVGAFLFKPNEKEFSDYIGVAIDEENVLGLLKNFQREYSVDNVLLTRGANGVVLSTNFGEEIELIKSQVRHVADVTGAGDTVISTFAVMYAVCGDLHLAARAANIAGGIVCEKSGVASVSAEELFLELKNMK